MPMQLSMTHIRRSMTARLIIGNHPECSCEGTNPNCYLCSGRGWTEHDEGSLVSRSARPNASQGDELDIDFLVKCDHCPEFCKKEMMAQHLRKKHSETTYSKRRRPRARKRKITAHPKTECATRGVKDGSSGYAAFARENGRFGSHSSFDAMFGDSDP